jgi:hypothetical protein
MIWWRRRRPTSPETAAARRRLEKAHQDLAAARADDAPVDEVAGKLQKFRSRNHFGPMITQALRGQK